MSLNHRYGLYDACARSGLIEVCTIIDKDRELESAISLFDFDS